MEKDEDPDRAIFRKIARNPEGKEETIDPEVAQKFQKIVRVFSIFPVFYFQKKSNFS